MKLNWLLVAVVGAAWLAYGIPIHFFGQERIHADGENQEEKPPASYVEVQSKIQKLGKALTRESTQAELDAYFVKGFKIMADYMRAHPDAKDMNELYTEAFFRANRGGSNEDFLQISEAYLKQYPDGRFARDWKTYYLAGCLSSDSRKEQATKELAAIEKDGKEDVDKALDAVGIRVLDASIRKDTEASSKAVAAMKSNEKLMAHLEKNQELRRNVWNFILGYSPAVVKVGEKLTDWGKVLPVQDLQGKDISLADYAGKPTLIVFWKMHGKIGTAELPGVVKAYEQFKEKGLDVIGVNLDYLSDDRVKDLRDAIEGKGKIGEKTGAMPWRHICASSQEGGLGRMYGVIEPPRNVLIDKEGKVVALNLWGEKLVEQLSTLLAAAK